MFSDLCHQLHVKCFSEVINVFTEVGSISIHLYLVLPLIVGPLFLEIQLRALGGLQLVDEIYLNFVDIHYVLYVPTSRIEGKITIDCSIVCTVNFQASFEGLG